ncbi:MAG TPA: hypothetical protein VGF75_05290 [Candidatus Saccharimonadales bacterium]|jgi:uridine kinase
MSVNLKNQLLQKQPKNSKYYLVAIDGRGGSGKTVLTEYIAKLLPDFIFLNGDDYFEPTPNEIAWGKFNDERFIEDVINPLKQGKTTIAYRPYDWHTEPNITERTITINKGVCIERCFSFAFDLDWDLKIWVETPSNIALQRALERDKMPQERAVKAWKEVWQPEEDTHIEKFKPLQSADLVINGTKSFAEQLRLA